jgi:hypothetical protein
VQKLLNYNYLYLIPLTLSAIASLRCFRLEWLKPYRVISWFLLVSLAIEAIAICWKWGLNHTAWWEYPKSNLWIYNAFLSIELAFYVTFYYQQLHSPKLRQIMRYGIGPVAVFGVLCYWFIQGPMALNTYTIIVYYIIFVLLSTAFFIQVLNEKEITVLRTHPGIWISLGTFIYYSVALPYCIFLPYLISHKLNWAISLFHINVALDTLMYCFYLISFLCKPQSLKPAY